VGGFHGRLPQLKVKNVSEEDVASFFVVEEQAQQEASVKIGGRQSSAFEYIAGERTVQL
jgi:hypothetical protein